MKSLLQSFNKQPRPIPRKAASRMILLKKPMNLTVDEIHRIHISSKNRIRKLMRKSLNSSRSLNK